MSRLFGPIFQMAYVVPELEPFLDHLGKTLGIGPFLCSRRRWHSSG